MFTKYGLQQILKQFSGKTNGTIASSCYLALSSTEPTFDGINIREPETNGYARTLLGSASHTYSQVLSEPTYDAETGETYVTNTKEIHFSEATGDWGTLGYFAIYSSQSGGSAIYVGQLNTAVTPTTNTIVVIRAGDLKISIK